MHHVLITTDQENFFAKVFDNKDAADHAAQNAHDVTGGTFDGYVFPAAQILAIPALIAACKEWKEWMVNNQATEDNTSWGKCITALNAAGEQ